MVNTKFRRDSLRLLLSMVILCSLAPLHVATAQGEAEEMTIAYIGEDGNVWIVSLPDQEQTQITSDGSMHHRAYGYHYDTEYRNPAWSADGSMLTFSSYGNGTTPGIHYWDGSDIHSVPGTEGCERPKFSPDGERIYFNCHTLVDSRLAEPADASTDPRLAIITSVKLDGSDIRPEITYAAEGEPGIPWMRASEVHVGQLMDIDHETGNLLVRVSTPSRSGYAVFASDGTPITDSVSIINNIVGPWDIKFSADGENVVASYCTSSCRRDTESSVVNQVKEHAFDGRTLHEITALTSNADILGLDVPRDADYVIASVLVSDETPPYIVKSERTADLEGAAAEFIVLTHGAYPAVRPSSNNSD